MSSLIEDLDDIKDVEDGLVGNKVANFAYEDSAYTNNQVNGVDDYNVSRAQNIPNANASVLKVNATVLAKGFRSQASSITRMLVNHFFGRVSYNLNKIHDNFSAFLTSLKSYIGQPNGIASLDADGRIPYSQLPESALEWKGEWDASTNTPHLEDGTGTSGDMYIVTVAGTQDLGSGDISFLVNDRVIYNGTVWQRFAGGDVRTVSEIPPDTNGNVDLSLQTDITKILAPNIIAKLFGKDMAKNWKKVVHTNSIPLTDMLGSTAYGDDYLIYGDRGLYLLKADMTCTQLVDNVVTACAVIGTTVVIAVQYYNEANAYIYCSDDLEHWTKESISATGFTDVKKVNFLYTANGMCIMGCGFGTTANNKYLYWSTDGKVWTASISNFGSTAQQEFYDIDYHNNMWLAVVTVVSSSASNATKLYSSTDGKSWTSRATANYGYPPRRTGIRCILYKDGVWLWFATGKTLTSTNGTSWTEKQINSRSFNFVYYSAYHMENCIVEVNGTYYFTVYVSGTGHYIVKTSDLQTFTIVYDFNMTTTSNALPSTLLYLQDEGKFLAIGNKYWITSSESPTGLVETNGRIWSSLDGDNWTEETDLNTHIYAKIFADNKFGDKIIIGRDGFLSVTEDMETWNKITGKLKAVPILGTFQFKGETIGGTFISSKDLTIGTSTYLSLDAVFNFKWNFSGCTAFIGKKIDNEHWESLSTIAGRSFDSMKCVTDGEVVLLYAQCTTPNNGLGEDTWQPRDILLKSSNLIDWEAIPLSALTQESVSYTTRLCSNIEGVNGRLYITIDALSKTYVSTDHGGTWQELNDVAKLSQNGLKVVNDLYIGIFLTGGNVSAVPKWSEDGIVWTDCTAVASCVISSFSQFGTLLIGWSRGIGKIAWSENGKDWFEGEGINTPVQNIRFYWVKKVNNIYFACGASVYYSVDGKSWHESTGFSGTLTVKDLAFGGGLYVLVTATASSEAFWSEDGVNWSACSIPTRITNEKLLCVGYKNGVWIIGTTNRLLRSLDGKTFEETATSLSSESGFMNGLNYAVEYESEWLTKGITAKYSGLDEIE